MDKHLRILLLGLGALVVAGFLGLALVVGYLGFLPGVSDAMGTSQPRDLGVKYTEADYESGLEKIPGHSVSNAEYLCISCDYTSSGSVPVDNTFTQEEFTAQLNKMNSLKGPLKNVQVKFGENGTVEASAMVKDPKLTAPIYVKGRLEVAGPHEVRVKLDYAEVGRAGVPGEQAKQAEEAANGAFAQFFSRNPGLSVESLTVEEGAVRFKGTFPQEIIGDPDTVARNLG
jgi:hypothetical protein